MIRILSVRACGEGHARERRDQRGTAGMPHKTLMGSDIEVYSAGDDQTDANFCRAAPVAQAALTVCRLEWQSLSPTISMNRRH